MCERMMSENDDSFFFRLLSPFLWFHSYAVAYVVNNMMCKYWLIVSADLRHCHSFTMRFSSYVYTVPYYSLELRIFSNWIKSLPLFANFLSTYLISLSIVVLLSRVMLNASKETKTPT